MSDDVTVALIGATVGLVTLLVTRRRESAKPPLSSGRTEAAPAEALAEALSLARAAMARADSAEERAAAAEAHARRTDRHVSDLMSGLRSLVREWRALATSARASGRAGEAAVREQCADDLDRHL